MLTRTLAVRLYPTKEQREVLNMLTRTSKSLYNEALYKVREYYNYTLAENQKYFNSIAYLGIAYKGKGEHLNYYALDPLMQQSRNYRLLGATTSKEILRLLDKSYKSWFNSLKVRKEKGLKPKPPGFKPKDGKHILVYNYTNFGFNGYLSSYKIIVKNQRYITLGSSKEFSKLYPQYKGILKFKLPVYLRGKYVKMVRIIPLYDDYKLELIYEIEPKIVGVIGTECMGIDLGLQNFATYVTTKGNCGIIDGSYIKSENRYYNKENAMLKSVAKKQGYDRSTERIITLTNKRESIINNFMDKAVAYILDLCLKEGIITVAIGELNAIKQEIDLGKQTNQNFVQIPYHKFKTKLQAKLELYGIELVQVNEAYTSQVDALALDKIQKQAYSNTRRVHRGLYESSTGKCINADINGALNIMRKVADDTQMRWVVSRGSWTEPERIRLAYEQTSLKLNDCLSSHP
jgi:IS605 OrfB family transposase